MSELKPCPFCGEMPELSTRPCYYYQCVKSGCEGQEVSWNNTEEEALKSWNTRPIEDALCAEVAKLMKENQRLNRINANSVSKMELDTCRSLNKALREDNVRLRKDNKALVEQINQMAKKEG
jgi:Lar family restriction alleviation protein